MRLGDFLSAANAPSPVKHVKFKAIGRPAGHPNVVVAEVEATLVCVSETDRSEAQREARKATADTPDQYDDEVIYQILFRAMRDSSSTDYTVPFAENVKALKNCLVKKTVTELWNQYTEFMAEEFPDSIDVDEFEKLVTEAEGKSLAVLLSECGFSKIYRALPSLAVRLGA